MAEDKAGGREGAVVRTVVAVTVLAIFFGALLSEFWSDLVPATLQMLGRARTIGAETLDSRYFDVRNNSGASEAQINMIVRTLESQYEAIASYTQKTPSQKIPVLFVNGQGMAVMDGMQLLINYDNGLIDTDTVPMFLAFLMEELPFDPNDGLAPAIGHALHIVEAAGIGEFLLRQPLDDWVALLRAEDVYLPLEEAWLVVLPNDEDGFYDLVRAMVESGSFMGWIAGQYGLDASRQLVQKTPVETITGKTLLENEEAWLKALDEKEIEPRTCDLVVPRSSIFSLICGKINEASD